MIANEPPSMFTIPTKKYANSILWFSKPIIPIINVMRMDRKILIPILNKSFTGLAVPTLYLSDKVVIEKITDEENGIIFSQTRSEINSLISRNTKCIKLLDLSTQNISKLLQKEVATISFLMNYFKKEAPISLMFGLLLLKKRKTRIEDILDLESSFDVLSYRKTNYKFDSGVSRKALMDFYEVLSKVAEQNDSLRLTLGRYNNALIRTNLFDRIVDITISLESLIDGTTELNYKFALYNAWASENDKKKRKSSFGILKQLYEARSKIVHGETLSKKSYKRYIKPIENNWDEILRIGKHAITYCVFYLFKKGPKTWASHQKNLALGLEDRITEEMEDKS